MFCQNCGKQIPENVKFCNHCGAAQVTVSTQNTQQTYQAGAQQQQQQSYQKLDDKMFKKYVTSIKERNLFIAMCVVAIPGFVIPPVGFGLALFAVLFGITWAVNSSNMKKRISIMQANGTYEKMLQEFSSSSSILNDKVRYSENYIFGKSSGCFLNYKDVYWIYRHIVRYLFIPLSSKVIVGDNTGKLLSLCKLKLSGATGDEEIKAVASIVHRKNPNVLLGFGAATQSEYKKRTK